MDATEKPPGVPVIEIDDNDESLVMNENVIDLDELPEPGSPKAVSNDVPKEQPSTDPKVISDIVDPLTTEVKETVDADSDSTKTAGDISNSIVTSDINPIAIPDDFIIDLDDSLEIEEPDDQKKDPLEQEPAATLEYITPEVSSSEVVNNLEESLKSLPTSKENNFVICIDSEDEDAHESEQNKPEEPPTELTVTETADIKADNTPDIPELITTETKKRSADELSSPNVESEPTSKEPPLKIAKLPSFECINLDCPKYPNSTYSRASEFVFRFYYVTVKANRGQFVCNSCVEKAINKFEIIGGALIQEIPVCDILVPKRAELVEIIDSDEESEPNDNDKVETADDSMKIEWDQESMINLQMSVMKYKGKINLEKQYEWADLRFKEKQEQHDKLLFDIDLTLKSVENKSSKMYRSFYTVNKTKVERRDSISISDEGEQCSSPEIPVSREQRPLAQYPPAKNFKKTKNILLNEKKGTYWYGLKTKPGDKKGIWTKCKVIEMITSYEKGTTKKMYSLQFIDNFPTNCNPSIVSGLEIAHNVPNENLNAGTRVIADFNPIKTYHKKYENLTFKKYLPGVVIEKKSQYNKERYLVKSNYGHYRYIATDAVLKIVDQSEAVKMTETIPTISVVRGDRVPVKLNESWLNAEVITIDCSIVKVRFHPETEEWIYCGSQRWGPFQTQAIVHNVPKSVAKKSTAKKSTQPVNFIRSSSSTSQPPTTSDTPAIPKVHILNDDNIYVDEPPQVSYLQHFTSRKDLQPRPYLPHTCNRVCCLAGYKLILTKYSTLTQPLVACWERQFVKHKTIKQVLYKAPCGRRLRNMAEIHKYLKITQNRFTVDNFDFEPSITVMTYFDVKKEACGLFLPDLAGGKEGMPIPVVNAFDNQRPPDMQYSSVRIPTKNVRIDKDPGFLMCCDCTDDCSDKSKCACFQNTIAGAKFRNIMELPDEEISYKYKRLYNMVQTGIYECNQRCKCNAKCFNRVVQQPIKIRMQLYRTKNRGWGLQCLHDIPKGTFICTYVGYLYPEKEANALCANEAHGDEYFAELDYIENVQQLKEGYESGVQFDDSDDEDDEKNSDSDSDYSAQEQQDDDFVANSAAASKRAIATRSSTVRPKRSGSGRKGEKELNNSHIDEDDDDLTPEEGSDPKPGTSKSDSSSDDEDQTEPKKDMINLVSDDESMKIAPDEPVVVKRPVNHTRSIRKMFGPRERVYILDAKQCGNVGRYFNHSCMPNLFVQSVFVDSHDPRFPWVSFFASTSIKAGDELTWNYNYEVGSVPGKLLFCKCGSTNCRTRIL